MSVLSDDTDVLLLIPPDFFAVPSDSEEDITALRKPNERLLVSDLISQVNDLEGRICMIENQSMPAQSNLQQLRHFGSLDTLNTSYKSSCNTRSLQTTPLKTQTLPSPVKSWRKNLSYSPAKYSKRSEYQNMLTSYHYVNQKEKDDQLLKEIHNFFKQKNTKISECNEKVLEDEKSVSVINEDESLHLSSAVFNLNKVNDLLKQLEETQAEIEEKLKLKTVSEIDSDNCSNLDKKQKNFSRLSEIASNTSTLDTKSPRRCLNFDTFSPKKNVKTDTNPVDEIAKKTDDLDADSVKTSQRTEETSLVDNTSDPQVSPKELKNLLSLCSLWGSSKKMDDTKLEDQRALSQKYQEEKCRRQHCEELIQKLQLRLLEDQQKIAVAIKVDKEKDEAIAKLTEGLNKLMGHWKDLENQKSIINKKLQTEKEKFQNEISLAHQTVKRYEVELSKALDLAHGYKEKCESSEKERNNFFFRANKEIENLKADLKDVTEKLIKEQNQTENLEKLVSAKEENLIQTKSKLQEAQNNIRDLKKNLKELQTEMEILKHDKEKLGERFKDEKNKISALEQSKKNLQQANDDLKKKEKFLKENIKGLTEQMEKIKIDLKEFYQEQVEKIVQEKLKEFQEQLATAERGLQKEIEEREKKVTEMAVKQVQQIVEKHVVEVNLLEEKHNEEIELWKIKVLQAEEKVSELQKKLDQYSNHKTEIAQKLQNIMETQWQEALKIITASSPQQQQQHKSPPNSGRSNADKELTRQNTFTMLSGGWGDGELNKNGAPVEVESPYKSPPIDTPFSRDGQLTFREQVNNNNKLNYRIDETPQKIEAETSDPLKKYIQMLLERPPGIPIDDSVDKSLDSTLFNSILDGSSFLKWQNVLSEKSSQINSDIGKQDFVKISKEKENKVPWK